MASKLPGARGPMGAPRSQIGADPPIRPTNNKDSEESKEDKSEEKDKDQEKENDNQEEEESKNQKPNDQKDNEEKGGGLSKQQMENLLEAINNIENDVNKKINANKGPTGWRPLSNIYLCGLVSFSCNHLIFLASAQHLDVPNGKKQGH